MKDKREALLDSALELFTSKGVQGTATSLISKNAGVATGTLFHYFPSKEDLVGQLYLKCKKDFIGVLQGSLIEGRSHKEQFTSALYGVIQWAVENRNEYLFMMQYYNADYINKDIKEEIDSLMKPLMQLLFSSDKKSREVDLQQDLQLEVIGSAINGVISFFVNNRDKLDSKEYRDCAASMCYRLLDNKGE